jgi:hypothetical protein
LDDQFLASLPSRATAITLHETEQKTVELKVAQDERK